jgi:hypothetical protein
LDRLQSFFLQLARKSFWDLGMADDKVVEYVAGVLTDFARTDSLYRIRSTSGRSLDSVVEILTETQPQTLQQSQMHQEREVRKYLGDYTLFMSGIFRTHVEKSGVLDYYMEEGRRSYWKVSQLDLSLYRAGFFLFQELSKNFEYYSGALDYMRKAHFASPPGEDPFGQFLKQVEGWIKTSLSNN